MKVRPDQKEKRKEKDKPMRTVFIQDKRSYRDDKEKMRKHFRTFQITISICQKNKGKKNNTKKKWQFQSFGKEKKGEKRESGKKSFKENDAIDLKKMKDSIKNDITKPLPIQPTEVLDRKREEVIL